NADNKGRRGIFLDAGTDLLHHFQIDAKQIVPAHARLTRHAGGDDTDAGAFNSLIGVGAGKLGIKAVNGRGLDEVERLALGNALGNAEQRAVPQLLESDEVGKRAANLAGTNQGNFRTRHVWGNLVRESGVAEPRRSRTQARAE